MALTQLDAPRSPRYRLLDHWRGIACLLVVIFHSSSVAFLTRESRGGDAADPVSGPLLALTRIGWAGVPFFFVISGYAISATADVFRRRDGGTRSYFIRRLRRIYPPYWAMLALMVAIVLVVDVVLTPRLLTRSIAPIARPWTLTPWEWIGNATLTESWRATAFPGTGAQAYVMGQAWTLCYEEQFYLVTGLLILLAPLAYFRGAAIITVIVAAIASLAPIVGVRVGGFFFDGYWLAFAAGILVYHRVNYGSASTRWVPWALLLAGAALGLVYAFTRRTDLGRDLVAAMVFAGILLALHRLDARLGKAPSLRPIKFLGTITFSLYLSHAVVVRTISQLLWNAGLQSPLATVFVVIPACVAVAILVGWLFWYAVERHFLNQPSPQPAVAPVAPDAQTAPAA